MAVIDQLSAVRYAQAISVPLAGAVAGLIGSMSFAAIPALTLAPADVAAKQWQRVFDIGVRSMPPTVILLAAHFGFLASRTSKVPGLYPQLSFDPTAPRVLYVAATVLSVAIVPFTILRMTPTNNQLKGAATSTVAPTGADNLRVQDLLVRWQGLNYVRAAMVGTGALLAGLATVLSS